MYHKFNPWQNSRAIALVIGVSLLASTPSLAYAKQSEKTLVVEITTPSANSVVAGEVQITVATAGNVTKVKLVVDGKRKGAMSSNSATWNSSQVKNGRHTIVVKAFHDGRQIGRSSTVVNVDNSSHYSTLEVNASLPTEADCVAAVNKSPLPENAPWNENDGTGYNSNVPPAGGVPTYFYQNPPCCSGVPLTDYARVDGNYSGSTDDLIRITACKWGIDEDYIRAQAWIESMWHQDCAAAHGGSGCNEGGDENNPSGNPSGLPTTPITPNGVFSAFDGFGGLSSPNHYDSWSIVQNKVYYEWMTWPMMEESTSFGLDLRYAEMRGCMNGNQQAYFNSQSSSQGDDYQRAVQAASSDPNGSSPVSGWSNLEYLSYGCIDTHYSGDWFSGQEDDYLQSFLESLSSVPWPGGVQ